MDVIASYFRTLRILLPKHQRDDILRELSEEVRSQVAERQTALGRPLDADEQSAIIGHYGHPLLTAAHYRGQQHLIGPVVFPYYWIVLKIALGLVAVGHVIGAVVVLAGGAPPAQLGQIAEHTIATALKVTGWITASGAFAEFWLSRSRTLENWRPGMPSPFQERARSTIERALACLPGGHHDRARWRQRRVSESPVSGLVIALVVSVWWLAGLKFPALFFGSGAANLTWGPAMNRLYPVLVVAQLTLLAEHCLRLTGQGPGSSGLGAPRYTRFFQVTRLAWVAAGWGLIYVVATSDHQWMVWHSPELAHANTTIVRFAGSDIALIDFVNYVWSMVFVLVALAGVWGFLTSLFPRSGRTSTAARA